MAGIAVLAKPVGRVERSSPSKDMETRSSTITGAKSGTSTRRKTGTLQQQLPPLTSKKATEVED